MVNRIPTSTGQIWELAEDNRHIEVVNPDFTPEDDRVADSERGWSRVRVLNDDFENYEYLTIPWRLFESETATYLVGVNESAL